MGFEPSFVNKYIFARLEGQPGVRVRPPGKSLLPGEVAYNPAEHKGHLLCPDSKCDARLHLNSGEKSRLGDSAPGHWPHFKANPNQTHHKECSADIPELLNDFGHTDTDYSIGWRFHLNMGEKYSDKFNRHARSLTGLNEKGRATVLDDSIRRRESRVIKTPDDLVKIMREGDASRLRDSIVINHGGVFGWTDFFVRKGRLQTKGPMKRWIGLAERLLVDADQPAFVEFQIPPNVKTADYYGQERLNAKLDTFYAKHPVTGRRITVVPIVQSAHPEIIPLMQQGGDFMAFCHPVMDRSKHNHELYFMKLNFKRPDHIIAGGLDEILKDIKFSEKKENPPTNMPVKPAWQGDLLGGVPVIAPGI